MNTCSEGGAVTKCGLAEGINYQRLAEGINKHEQGSARGLRQTEAGVHRKIG